MGDGGEREVRRRTPRTPRRDRSRANRRTREGSRRRAPMPKRSRRSSSSSCTKCARSAGRSAPDSRLTGTVAGCVMRPSRARGPPPARWRRSPPRRAPTTRTPLRRPTARDTRRRSSISWKKRLNASLSDCMTSAYDAGGAARKKTPNMPPTCAAENATPRRFATPFRPSTSAAVRAVEPVEEAGLEDELQRREAGRHGDRVAGERPGLIHRPQRRDLLHDVAPPAERADRHAAADHLAERRQVGRDAVEPLRAARAHAKAGHHLVEDEHRAVLACRARASPAGTRATRARGSCCPPPAPRSPLRSRRPACGTRPRAAARR